MRSTVITGLVGAMIIGFSSFFIGEARTSTTAPADMDGNPVGYHISGSLTVGTQSNQIKCTSTCNFTMDFKFWPQTSTPTPTSCQTPSNCLHVSNSSSNVTATIDYENGWKITRNDLNADASISSP